LKYQDELFQLGATYGDDCIDLIMRYDDEVVEGIRKYKDTFMNRYRDEGDAFVEEYLEKKGEVFESGIKSVDELFSNKSIEHLEKIDGFDKKHNGIKGAHTLESFNKYNERPVKIISKIEVSEGIYELKYQVGTLEKGKPVVAENGDYVWYQRVYKKTVVDTNELSTEELVTMAKEAFTGRNYYTTSGNQLYINGTSSAGVKFEGWINKETGQLDSFYPVSEWKHNY
ncbi:MAG: EndoU domain-containing protein, partial [Lachnospiraceae bacterium]|nr:EndoU domain-containing protein [Lachnospiraceae bacterium]